MAVTLDFLERFLKTFGAPLAEHSPWPFLATRAFGFDKLKKLNLVNRDVLSDKRGMLEMLCINAIMFAANTANLLGLRRNYSPMLEGIATNFLPECDFADVNHSLLKIARINLLHMKAPKGDGTRAVIEAVGAQFFTHLDFEEGEDPSLKLRQLHMTKPGGRPWTRMTYATIERIEAANSLSEIRALEMELCNTLENLLDEEDSLRGKSGVYEALAACAWRRKDYVAALQHLDTTVVLVQRIYNITPQEVNALLGCRDQIVACQVAEQNDRWIV